MTVTPTDPQRFAEAQRLRELEKCLRAAGWSRREARVEIARLKREALSGRSA